MSAASEKTVMILLTKGSQILLLRRLNTWFGENQFAPPGGLVDEQESPEQAAVRELQEETGITTPEASLRLVHKSESSGNDRKFTNYYFHTTDFSGEVINNESDRHDSLDWYDIENLPEPIMPLVNDLLEKLKHERTR